MYMTYALQLGLKWRKWLATPLADVQSSEFLFVNVYAPKTVPEQRCFYDRLNEKIELER